MNLFDLAAKISFDSREYEAGINKAKKSMSEYKSDVMKLANVYKKQGMDMSAATTRAYAEIDKSQYETAENAKESAGKFSVNWEKAGEVISNVAEKTQKGFSVISKASIAAANKTIELGEKIVSVGDKAAKTFAAVETTIATAVGTIIKESVEGYGSFEQLVGGVETLFGAGGQSLEEYAKSVGKTVDEATDEYNRLMASQDAVIKAAAGAYKTAGMDANTYMETVTSFSASLLQGLGGDTVAAAAYADKAITDMADNANKMGSEISMIQNAYSGFARKNWTMLDNLKLGYSGSASEMARLINDSGVLGDAITVTAETVNNVSFDKVIEAIHVVQTNLGITGTTAKEAASTIQGSIASAKAAFTNFAVGLADGSQDIDFLFDNLIESLDTAADNIAPRIISSIDRISDVVETRSDEIADFIAGIATDAAGQAPKFVGIATTILQKIISNVSDNREAMASAGLEFFEGLLTSFDETLDMALPIIETLAPTVAKGFLKYGSTLFVAGAKIIMSVVEGMAGDSDELANAAAEALILILDTVDENIDTFLEAGEKIIVSIGNALEKNGGKLGDSAKSIVAKIISFAISRFPDILDFGLDVIESVIEGIEENSDELADTAEKIIVLFADFISNNADEMITAALGLILKLAECLTEPETLGTLVGAAISIILAIVNGILEQDALLTEGAISIISNLVLALTENEGHLAGAAIRLVLALNNALISPEMIGVLVGGAFELVGAIIGGILFHSTSIYDTGSHIIESVKEGFMNLDPAEWGADLIENFIEGIKSGWSNLTNAVGNTAQKVKDFLGFSEPEKGPLSNFHTYAPDMMDLFVKGIEDNENKLTAQIEKTFNIEEKIKDGIHEDAVEIQTRDIIEHSDEEPRQTIETESKKIEIVNNITINGAEYEDADALAEAVAEKIDEMTNRRKDGDLE